MNSRRDPKTMNPYLLIVVILAVGLDDVASGAAAPAISSMIEEFPQVSVTTIQSITTLPNLSIVIMSPLYGWLSTVIQPRKLILFALFLFMAAGTAPAFLSDMTAIMICRFLLGLGSGITIPAAISLIPIFFQGDLRDKLIGWNMAMGCAGAVCMQTIGGYLTLLDWRYCFFAYLFPIWVFVLVFFFLPNVPQDPRLSERRIKKPAVSFFTLLCKVPPRIYGLLMVYFFIVVFRCLLSTNISIVIEGEGIGTSANSGLGLSLYTLSALAGGLLFGKLKTLMRSYIIAFSWFVLGAGFLLSFLSMEILPFYLSMLVAGLGMGIMVPAYYARAAELCEGASATFSISLIASVTGLANFFHPFIVKFLLNLLGQEVGRFPLAMSAAFSLAGALVLAVIQQLSNRRHT